MSSTQMYVFLHIIKQTITCKNVIFDNMSSILHKQHIKEEKERKNYNKKKDQTKEFLTEKNNNNRLELLGSRGSINLERILGSYEPRII